MEEFKRKKPSLHIHDDEPLSFVWLFNGHCSQRWSLLIVNLNVPIGQTKQKNVDVVNQC